MTRSDRQRKFIPCLMVSRLLDRALCSSLGEATQMDTVLMIYFVSVWFTLSVIVENGVRLRLNIVDTPGYGDQVNNDNWLV